MYPFGVEVILIEPGYIVTNLQNTAAELMEPYAHKITTGLTRGFIREHSRGLRREEKVEDHGGWLRAGYVDGY